MNIMLAGRLRRLAALLATLTLAIPWHAAPAQPLAVSTAWQARVEPLALSASASGEAEFLVFLQEQADLSGIPISATKAEKGEYVYRQLVATAQRAQTGLVAMLAAQGVAYRAYWVANLVWVRGDLSVLQSIAVRPEVAHIYANPLVKMDIPDLPTAGLDGLDSPQGVEWNIQLVGAPQVWAAGYTGQGAVIGGQDTGYDWTHPALMPAYRGWDGTAADHNYSWHDAIHQNDPQTSPGNPCGFDLQAPCDDNGHGTHTMGTMIGDDGIGNQVGMAPGARWIGCRNMEQGWGKPSTYLECYQWFLAPTDLSGNHPRPDLAPDVINNSWACTQSEGCTDPFVLQQAVENLRQAGILSVHSAGNSGPSCGTVNEPAAIYDASFSVGATNAADQIASFSSRGPAAFSGLLKPDISAPGVSIRSSAPGGGYVLLSGTSMAAPHVAGLAALLLSAYPALSGQVDALESGIERSALPLASSQACGNIPVGQVPNAVYGWGRIDAASAYNRLRIAVEEGVSTPSIAPGGTLTYTLTVRNLHMSEIATNVVLTDTLPAGTLFVQATQPYLLQNGLIRWDFGQIGPGSSAKVDLTVNIPEGYLGMLVNNQYAVTSDQVQLPVTGPPVIVRVGASFQFLPLLFR